MLRRQAWRSTAMAPAALCLLCRLPLRHSRSAHCSFCALRLPGNLKRNGRAGQSGSIAPQAPLAADCRPCRSSNNGNAAPQRPSSVPLRSAPLRFGQQLRKLRCCLSAPLRATTLHSARSLLRHQAWRSRAPAHVASASLPACLCAAALQRISFSARFACPQGGAVQQYRLCSGWRQLADPVPKVQRYLARSVTLFARFSARSAKSAPSLSRSQPNVCLCTDDFHASNHHAKNNYHTHTPDINHIEQ